MTIPFENQTAGARDCGAACLAMVYQSFGKPVPQESIWPVIAKPNRFGVLSSTTHLMALHANAQGFPAVVVQARHPIQTLRICAGHGIRAILNHRPSAAASNGHYSVLVDVDAKDVVLHDPAAGAARRIPHDEFAQLWQPLAGQSEIAGNMLIAIAADPPAVPACEFCHTAIPEAMACPRCGKPVKLSPAAVLGCVRDGCIARMWNYVACSSCDFVFNESSKADAEASGAARPAAPTIAVPDLSAAFAQLDRFLEVVLRVPGMAAHPDIQAQLAFIETAKQQAIQGQAEKIAEINAQLASLQAARQNARARSEELAKKLQEQNAPPPPLDPGALAEALLKNLGLR